MAFTIVISIVGKGTNSPQNNLRLCVPLCIFIVIRGEIRLVVSLYKPLIQVNLSCYIERYQSVLRTAQKCFTLHFPGRPVQLNTVSTSLLVHMSTTVYSKVHIYIAE